jgi:predicted ATPase
VSVSAPFVRRVRLRNYKSIASCDVELRALTFLVGRNGSGKSNFLDALHFVADALRTSLDHALRARGGIKEVRRKSTGHPTSFQIKLDLDLGHGGRASYAFNVSARGEGGWVVTDERCEVETLSGGDGQFVEGRHFFVVKHGAVVSSSESVLPPVANDRLLLVAAAGLPAFTPLFDQLSRMGFYNLSPERIREPQPPDAGELLLRDGRNLASVFSALANRAPAIKTRIIEYLGKVAPGVEDVARLSIGAYETLEFRQDVAGAKAPWTFPARNMSDGTLRAFAILVALFQAAADTKHPVRLIGIEEPETALHPAASGVLLGCLRDASADTQVIVTSHSADLLDDDSLAPDSLLAVAAHGGETVVNQVDEVGRTAMRDHLATAGELLRQDQLLPEGATSLAQGDLFGEEA